MSTVLRPTGPLPPQVYWTRRLLVVGGVLLVIIIVWALVARGGGDTPAPAETPDPEGAAVTEGEDGDDDVDGARTCTEDDLDLAVATAQREHPAGAQPSLEVTVTNSSEASCVADLAAAEILITSGSDRIWSSTDCAADDAAEQVVLLPAGASETWVTTWQRVRSDEQCRDGLPEPRPGTYRVEVALLGATSEQAVFDLG